MISIGAKININFKLKVVNQGQLQEVTFSELLTRPTIVSVYMKNNTPSCDNQIRSLVEHASWFDQAGFNLLAISKDGCRAHQNFAKKHAIPFMLGSDPEFNFSKATQSIVEKKMFGKSFVGPSRSAFVIGTDGTILGIIEKVDTKIHGEELKALVNSLK